MKMVSVLLASVLSTPVSFALDKATYQVDPMHSKIGFEVPHLVISSVEGRFAQFEGQLTLSDKVSDWQVSATAEAASIDTGVSKRDEHLRSGDFFDVQKFPQLRLKSTKLVGEPKKFRLFADVTIKDKTKNIVFEGQYLGSVKDAYGNDKVAFTLRAKINRQDFGLTWHKAVEAGPVVGNEVTLELKVQAAKQAEVKVK